MQEAQRQYEDYKVFAISQNREPYKNFLEAMYEIEAMLIIRLPDEKLTESFVRTLYASCITSMETYLSDTFINKVMNEESLCGNALSPTRN